MTTADYVAIAISPALIMAMVGSLVFFLIEVFYVGQHQARLNYVFALFVFAAVLIARISIEMGSERAVLFALPLGLVTFLVTVRFVQQPGPLGHLVNLALLGVVWWSAHKLTWDCTLIDDDQDSSGEGLMQGVGRFFSRRKRSTAEEEAGGAAARPATPAPSVENELLANPDHLGAAGATWWSQWRERRNRPHAPGLWVLYFSLAALPLFGLGQRWIPTGPIASRRYAFALLIVYVSAALGLLVTTSFLGLRRYLRQRRVEMPAPMAATWVSVGAALIVFVMLLAALIPRPAAEYALSRPPWQVGSPGGLSPARQSFGENGAGRRQDARAVQSDQVQSPNAETSGEERGVPAEQPGDHEDAAQAMQSDGDQGHGLASEGDDQSAQSQGEMASSDSRNPQQQPSAETDRPQDRSQPSGDPSSNGPPSGADRPSLLEFVQHLPAASLMNILKWVVYAALAGFALYLLWTHRTQLLTAFAELIRGIREFIARILGEGGLSGGDEHSGNRVSDTRLRPRSFREYPDPFATGSYRQLPPHELVRYTFEAFEAWARDRGHPRSPDQTPHELVRTALDPHGPMCAEANRMAQLYNETAYGSGAVSREAANGLQNLWSLMRGGNR